MTGETHAAKIAKMEQMRDSKIKAILIKLEIFKVSIEEKKTTLDQRYEEEKKISANKITLLEEAYASKIDAEKKLLAYGRLFNEKIDQV